MARVAPARQRLDGDDLAAVERDDRLEVGDHLAVLERGGQLVAAASPPLAGRLHLGEPHAHLALAGVLGAVHRHVGVVHQLVRRRASPPPRSRCRRSSAPRSPRRRRSPARPADRGCGRRPARRGGRRRPPAAPRTRRRPCAPRRRPAGCTASIRPAAATSTASPAAWPAPSLIALKSSRSRNSTVAMPAPARQRLLHAAQEQRAVGEPGQRVALRLALEPVELERQAGVRGERLEQPQVLVGERRASRRSGRRAPSRPRAASRRAPARSAPPRSRARPGSARARARSRRAARARRARTATAARSARGARGPIATIASSRPSGAERRAQRAVVRRQQHDLGRPHAEARARAAQQVEQLGLEITPARERAGHAVEELEALVLGALGHVGAVGDAAGRRRRDQQPAGAQVMRRRSWRPTARRSRS